MRSPPALRCYDHDPILPSSIRAEGSYIPYYDRTIVIRVVLYDRTTNARVDNTIVERFSPNRSIIISTLGPMMPEMSYYVRYCTSSTV